MSILNYFSTMKNHSVFLLSISLFFLFQVNKIWSQKPYQGKVILAIFAHPDDESTVAPILAKYVREGAKVHLVIATDGRYGTNDYHNHKAGETLVATRRSEMKCAAEKLGASLTHLVYHDQLKANEGYNGHVPHARALIRELYDIVEKEQPNVIITWGPDGGSTHMDHRLISTSVTQLFISRDWQRPMSLFYYGTPSENLEDSDSKILRGQAKKYLKTKIPYTQQDLDKSFYSIKCHYSQIDPNMTKQEFEKRKTKNGLFVYLRKFKGPTKASDSLFE